MGPGRMRFDVRFLSYKENIAGEFFLITSKSILYICLQNCFSENLFFNFPKRYKKSNFKVGQMTGQENLQKDKIIKTLMLVRFSLR